MSAHRSLAPPLSTLGGFPHPRSQPSTDCVQNLFPTDLFDEGTHESIPFFVPFFFLQNGPSRNGLTSQEECFWVDRGELIIYSTFLQISF